MEQLDFAPSLICEQISRMAGFSPQAVALSSGSEKLSYEELDRRSSQFARYLIESRVLPGSTLAICLDRSFDWIIAALAILRSGSAYVPLDPAWPDARIRYAVEDSGAAALIAPVALLNRLELNAHGIDPVLHADAIAAMPRLEPRSNDPDSLAYVIYTSGSTGKPKGVEITHANLSHLIEWHVNEFHLTPQDRCSHLAGLAFDAAVWEIWPALAAGACLCIPDDTVRLSPDLIQEWMVQEQVTVGFVPTVHTAKLIEMRWPVNTALRTLLTGGDALPHSPAAGLPFALVNNYGPTECTVVATSGLIRSESTGTPSIGDAIAGAWIYLLDDEGRPIQEGEVGEIYVGGGGVGRGYRNLPESTRASFLPDPFSDKPDARMYRTGDRGARRPDGQIEFHGRNDRQVKIRGQRIELDEISNRLNQHPSVQFAIVTAGSTHGDQVELIAHVLFKQGSQPANATDLQDYLRKDLPSYMVPGTFFRLRELPVSSNGKIDLAMLTKTAGEPLPVRKAVEHAGNQIQGALLKTVRELIKNPSIGPKENFFLAGGHSLLGMQLIMRLRETYKVDMTARELFDGPTVEQLASRVERKLAQSRLGKIWKELLNVDRCGADANFAALGGDDRLVDELQMRIAAEFGCYLSRTELAASKTLAAQAELVHGALEAEPSLPPGVFMVHSERQSQNIFWLHYPTPMLAEALGSEQPILCLTLTEHDFETLGEVPTLQEIARCFLPKILASQPSGPYIVGGFCLGGILSYEVACQLRAAGFEVSLLVLLDVPSPEYYRPAALQSLLKRPGYVTKRFKQLGFRKTLARLIDRASEKIQIKAERSLVQEHNVRTQEIMENAAYRYRPSTYAGKVALIMASQPQPNSPPHDHFLPWWRNLIQENLHEHAVDAIHLDLVGGAAVDKVAEAITSHLKQAEQMTVNV